MGSYVVHVARAWFFGFFGCFFLFWGGGGWGRLNRGMIKRGRFSGNEKDRYCITNLLRYG